MNISIKVDEKSNMDLEIEVEEVFTHVKRFFD